MDIFAFELKLTELWTWTVAQGSCPKYWIKTCSRHVCPTDACGVKISDMEQVYSPRIIEKSFSSRVLSRFNDWLELKFNGMFLGLCSLRANKCSSKWYQFGYSFIANGGFCQGSNSSSNPRFWPWIRPCSAKELFSDPLTDLFPDRFGRGNLPAVFISKSFHQEKVCLFHKKISIRLLWWRRCTTYLSNNLCINKYNLP